MQYDIQCRGLPATATLIGHVRRRLDFGLARHGSRVSRVHVRLDRAEDPARGGHSACHIRIQLVDAAPVVVDDLGPDLITVINRCSDRAARGAALRLERAHFGRQTGAEVPPSAIQEPLPQTAAMRRRQAAGATALSAG